MAFDHKASEQVALRHFGRFVETARRAGYDVTTEAYSGYIGQDTGPMQYYAMVTIDGREYQTLFNWEYPQGSGFRNGDHKSKVLDALLNKVTGWPLPQWY
jgi:hypothetical protein